MRRNAFAVVISHAAGYDDSVDTVEAPPDSSVGSSSKVTQPAKKKLERFHFTKGGKNAVKSVFDNSVMSRMPDYFLHFQESGVCTSVSTSFFMKQLSRRCIYSLSI